MKKRKLNFVIIMFAIFVVGLTGCAKGGKYYYCEPYAHKNTLKEDNSKKDEELGDITEEQRIACEEIYKNVSEYYKLEKSIPKFATGIREKDESNIEVYAWYDKKKDMVIINPSFDPNKQNDVAVVAHELIHYLSDNGSEEVNSYMIENYQFGTKFLEGATNYLSTQVYPFEKGLCMYEYETHCAELMANAIGEDMFRTCYFTNNIEELRKDFNETLSDIYPNDVRVKDYEDIKFTAFDILVGNIDMYYLYLATITDFLEEKQLFKIANSCEEELLMYNKKKGKDATEITSNFLKNEQKISWSYFSKFSEIIEEVKKYKV